VSGILPRVQFLVYPCKYCGTEMKIYPSNRFRIVCSRECANKLRAKIGKAERKKRDY